MSILDGPMAIYGYNEWGAVAPLYEPEMKGISEPTKGRVSYASYACTPPMCALWAVMPIL